MRSKYFIYLWYVVIMLATSYLALVLPMVYVYGSDIDFLFRQEIELFISLFFVVDIILSLKKNIALDRDITHWRNSNKADYLRKFFWLNLLSVLPLDLIFSWPGFIFFRMLKVFKAADYLGIIQRTEVRYAYDIRIALLVFWAAHISHWISCLWIGMRGVDGQVDVGTDYINGLYWAVTTLTTVGYGDIVPQTNEQRILTMIVQFMGVGFYGYVIANSTELISQKDPAKVQYLSNL